MVQLSVLSIDLSRCVGVAPFFFFFSCEMLSFVVSRDVTCHVK